MIKEMQNYQRVKNLQETISGLTETYQMICRVNLDNGKKEILLNNEDGTDGLYITQFIMKIIQYMAKYMLTVIQK